ncbi:MAG: hypothetical protein LBJ17_07745 [Dysgonamonadaceae bacterium]|jgi:hypothetical protein|nr:hypothetical protein [Dysgonamonadaceae bacterium]
MKKKLLSLLTTLAISVFSISLSAQEWHEPFKAQLPFLGHRNWILIVDKACPVMSSQGIEMLYTGENIETVVNYTLYRLGQQKHLRPVIYTDKELEYLDSLAVPKAQYLKQFYNTAFDGYDRKSVWHDEIFPKINKISEQFFVLVLKTNTTIPYSSVFIELDCGYWNPESEQSLRDTIKNNKTSQQ